VIVVSTPASGLLILNGSPVLAGQQINVSVIEAGQLLYRPDAQVSGDDEFQFQVVDDGIAPGENTSVTTATLTIQVAGVNDAPIGSDNTVTTDEDLPYIFTAVDFGFVDSNDQTDELAGVVIVSLPDLGSLTLAGVAISVGDIISAADLGNGQLQYLANENESGLAYARFMFRVQDDNTQPGQNTDLQARELTLNVNPVSDAPFGSDSTTFELEDNDYVITLADIGFNDTADGDSLFGVTIEQLPQFGSILLNGVAVIDGMTISAGDIQSGMLIYRSNENFHGNDELQFRVVDNGQFASSVTGSVSNISAGTFTLQLAIESVNDEPSGSNITISTNEDSVHTFTSDEFGFSDLADSGDDHQFIAITISSLPEIGSLTVAGIEVVVGQIVSVTEIDSGLLQYRPPQNETGTGYRGIGFQVHDSGGTENGGLDIDQTPNQINFDLPGVNDSPFLQNNGAVVAEGGSIVIDSGVLFATDADDPDPDELMFTITELPLHGELTLNGQVVSVGDQFSLQLILDEALSYSHDESETSSDSFGVAVTDGGEDNSQAAIGDFQLTITEVIDPAPVVENDQLELVFGELFESLDGDLLESGFSALNNGNLIDQQRFTVTLEQAPTRGVVELRPDGTFRYEHDGSPIYTDQFSYRVTNEDGIFTIATVAITIEPPLDAAFGSPAPTTPEIPPESVSPVGQNAESEPEEEMVETLQNESQLSSQAFATLTATERQESASDILGVSQAITNGTRLVRTSIDDSAFLGVIQHRKSNTAVFVSDALSAVGQTTLDIMLEVKVPTAREVADNPLFLDGLSKLQDDLDDAESQKGLRFSVAEETVLAASLSASVGIISWALRGGAMFASLMSAGPLWWSIDMARVSTSVVSPAAPKTNKDNEGQSDDGNLEKIFEDER